MAKGSVCKQGNSNKRCVIYARVSTDKQAEQNISIPDQIARARVYADVQGWNVVEEYIDAGGSGRDELNRPSFREMISKALLPTQPIDFILVHSFSRFYRHHARSELLREQLKKNKVQVRSLTQEIVDDGGGGTFALSVMGLIDEYQSRETSKHVRRAMEANAREGFRNGGGLPYGYESKIVEIRGNRSKKRLSIKESEASLVRSIFNMALGGLGIRRIARILYENGSKTRSGTPFYTSQIDRILNNETYIGKSYYRPRDPLTGEVSPKNEWILVPCDPIIDEKTFARVQAIQSRRSPQITPPRHTSSNVLLGGIARCGSCGCSLTLCTGTSSAKTCLRYYRCTGHVNRGGCAGGNPISVREERLDQTVLDALAERLLTGERLKEITDAMAASEKSGREDLQNRKRAIERDIIRLKREEQNLWDLAGNLGLNASEGFKAKLENIEAQRINANRVLIEIEFERENVHHSLSDDEAAKIASKLREFLHRADIDLRRRFVRTFVTSVVVSAKEVEISGPKAVLSRAISVSDIAVPDELLRVRAFDHSWVTICVSVGIEPPSGGFFLA